MEPSELRIGNLVEYNGEVFKIYGLSHEKPFLDTIEFGDGVVEWDDLKPIPLTEKWLMRFGFNKDNKNPGWYDLRYLTNEHDDLVTSWVSISVNTYSFSCVIRDEYPDEMGANTKCLIRLVHQLQNLYFALTGEELVYNPSL
jgi:hypothetical protein